MADTDKLAAYRGKRSAARTPEPVPQPGPLPTGGDDTFVIQEHHARRLHWDFRLERGGVLVSWALPKGLPTDPRRNHLAVPTEDHPLEYASFEGEIAAGEYGGGRVSIWDRGGYECEKWSDREVMVVLHGTRAQGRYVLFRTEDDSWLIHRMAPKASTASRIAASPHATAPTRTPTPTADLVRPMLATPGPLPPAARDAEYGYELKWDGVRAVVYVEHDRVQVLGRRDRDATNAYPELGGLGAVLAGTSVVLDGEIVAFDRTTGRVSFAALQRRMHVQDPVRVRRLVEQVPVTYLAFDLLHLDGRSTVRVPYRQRRELLEQLDLRGPRWDTPPYFEGGGADVLAASAQHGLEGVVAKRLDSVYQPGRRSRSWIKTKNIATQDVVIGGWKPGKGRRADTVGSLLLGVPGDGGLEYVGHVGTGFTDAVLDDLHRRLTGLERRGSPFAERLEPQVAKDARWAAPELVGEVAFAEWTPDGRMRHPTWRGLRRDLGADEVVRET